MAQSESRHQFRDLVDAFKRGDVSRRKFIAGAAALGIAAQHANWFASASEAIAAGKGSSRNLYFAAQDAAGPPSAGTEGKTRGQDGELRIIQWQAPVHAFAHVATGTKEVLASDLVLQPLYRYLPDGSIFPQLASEFPSVEAGTLAEDLTWADVKLKENILWSDGTPFTSKDVVFTWQWITNSSNAAVTFDLWSTISNAEAVDDYTVRFTFASSAVTWSDPLIGGVYGAIIPSHAFGDDPANANLDWYIRPIGTGPFKYDSFSPNDEATLSVNENYYEENKPYFSSIYLKGGGEAADAARGVLQTGEYDYAWNLQVEPTVLASMISDGGPGTLEVELGTSLERMHLNFSDPNTEFEGQKSHKDVPHPILSDPLVRQALNKTIDRQTIADEFYGNGQAPAKDILNGVAAYTSPNTTWEYNLEAAAALLDEAGWVLDGGVRKKDGAELSLVYATSINAVRQKNQELVKRDWESLGIKVQLEQIDAGTYFGGDPAVDTTINKFYWDVDMYTSQLSTLVPTSFLEQWYAGADDEGIAQESNQWSKANYSRYRSAEFDTRFEALRVATSLEEAFALLVELNDIVISDVACIPEVNRAADVYAVGTRILLDNVQLGFGFEYNYWNIANWTLAE